MVYISRSCFRFPRHNTGVCSYTMGNMGEVRVVGWSAIAATANHPAARTSLVNRHAIRIDADPFVQRVK